MAEHHRPPGDDPTTAGLARALELLPEPDREVLLLAGWDGLTPGQIATVLGCSPPAARVRLHRARRRLRALPDSEDLTRDRTHGPSPVAPRPTPILDVPR